MTDTVYLRQYLDDEPIVVSSTVLTPTAPQNPPVEDISYIRRHLDDPS